MFAKIHARLGDFWWYSLMLFCACRAADLLNAFVGLWLVPKYVSPTDLGAVMPLTSFATFIAMPISIFAMTFMKELTTLATHCEFGRMKSLMRGVFIGAGAFLLLAVVTTYFVLPHFLWRIRVEIGSLGVIIVSYAFLQAVLPVYSNALQALKRFKTISFLGIVGAPIRFFVMLVAMPYRALVGYFVGQAATPAFQIVASVWSLRKELSVPAEPYWSRPVFKKFALLLIGIAACYYSGSILGLVEQTVLRQRLSDIDSAAYYMTTRFSDIATFVSSSLIIVLFPFTASLAANGKPTRPLVVKSSLAMLATGGLLAAVFALFGKPLLAILPDGDKYAEFWWATPWLIGIGSLGAVQVFHTNTEISASRFAFLKWWVPVHLVGAAVLLFVTGYLYFSDYLPDSWTSFLATHNFNSLKAMLWWFTITTLIKTAFSINELLRQSSETHTA